jgi:hypothetical protein
MVSRWFVLIIGVSLMISDALGCSVGGTGLRPMCERFWNHEAVALVDVIAIEKRPPLNRRYVTLRTVEVFRGLPPSEITFPDPESTCGVNFETTGRQLVWLIQERGKWRAFGDQDYENKAFDLAFARSMTKHPPATAYIFGTAGRPNHKWTVMGGPPAMLSPLEGALVVADRSGTRYEARVDKAGNFKLPDLPPGTYRVNVERLPSNIEGDPEEIELHGGACRELHLRPDTSGEIS